MQKKQQQKNNNTQVCVHLIVFCEATCYEANFQIVIHSGAQSCLM